MFVGDGQKAINAVQEAFRVLLIGQIVQKHAHRVEAERLGVAQFAVNCGLVKRRGLPHFDLVDGARRQKS